MPLPSTMTPIATFTCSGNQETVTFSNIPQTYTDLIVVAGNIRHSYAGSAGVYAGFLRFNSDSGTNYSLTGLWGNGTITGTERQTDRTLIPTWLAMASAAPGTITANIQNYSNNTTYKTTLIRTGTATGDVVVEVGTWRSTAAINSVSFPIASPYYWVNGTTFTLYGIKAA